MVRPRQDTYLPITYLPARALLKPFGSPNLQTGNPYADPYICIVLPLTLVGPILSFKNGEISGRRSGFRR